VGKRASDGDRPAEAALVKRSVRLGEFARKGLEGLAARWDLALSALVSQAVIYYLFDRNSDRSVRRVPRFPKRSTDGRPPSEVSVALDERHWSLVEDEVRLQQTDVDILVEYAVLYYLGDVDSGRIARRLVAAAEAGLGPSGRPTGGSATS
jgi:hypothetical protein